MTRRRVSSLRPTTGSAVLALFALALFGASRTTGSGWLVLLVAGMVAALLVGLVAPVRAVMMVEVTLATSSDGTVGRPLPITLTVTRPRQGMRVRVVELETDWSWALAPGKGEVMATPHRRGVFTALNVEVRCGAPLGLLWARRTLQVSLPRPLEVAPRPVPMPLPVELRAGAEGDAAPPRRRRGLDTVRGVREYAVGDPLKLIHWPATARRGRLVVKEFEVPESPRLAVQVDLRGHPDAAERAASRAAGLVQAARRAGLPVTLLTAEPGGPRAGAVGSILEAGRRLARAVPGPPAQGPVEPGTHIAVVTAT